MTPSFCWQMSTVNISILNSISLVYVALRRLNSRISPREAQKWLKKVILANLKSVPPTSKLVFYLSHKSIWTLLKLTYSMLAKLSEMVEKSVLGIEKFQSSNVISVRFGKALKRLSRWVTISLWCRLILIWLTLPNSYLLLMTFSCVFFSYRLNYIES